MINMFSAQNKMNRIYRKPKDSIYKHKFFENLCSGYSFILGEKNVKRDFFSFEPRECKIAKLIEETCGYDMSYRLEQVINYVAYSLMVYGKAYVHITPEYTVSLDNENKETKVMTAIQIEEIKGFIKSHRKDKIKFCYKGYNGEINDMEMQYNQLIVFDIRELGYRKRYFTNICKKLADCDITSLSTFMIEKNLEGYNFSVHSAKNKIKELKALKGIGWTFGKDGLSDSYILYKKIQEDELRIKFLNYILEKLNDGLEIFIGTTGGKLIAHIKEKNYDQLWKDYSDGKITGTELTNILYHNV